MSTDKREPTVFMWLTWEPPTHPVRRVAFSLAALLVQLTGWGWAGLAAFRLGRFRVSR